MTAQAGKREFRIAGPRPPASNCMLPPLTRLQGAPALIGRDHVIIVHAPRRSGRTTCLAALAGEINSWGDRQALACPLAGMKAVTGAAGPVTDLTGGVDSLVAIFDPALRHSDVPALKAQGFSNGRRLEPYGDCRIKLQPRLASEDPDRETAVLFDDADASRGKLPSHFPSQPRDAYIDRKTSGKRIFPSPIAFSCQRDLADCIFGDDPTENLKAQNASPFNVTEESLAIPDFTEPDIRSLYGQYAQAAGRRFGGGAIERAWHWPEGRPWLVNALIREIAGTGSCCGPAGGISGDSFDAAAVRIISGAGTHLSWPDDIIAGDPRVRAAAEWVAAGRPRGPDVHPHDLRYRVDPGILKEGGDGVYDCRPANPIYAEVLVRSLAKRIERRGTECTEGEEA